MANTADAMKYEQFLKMGNSIRMASALRILESNEYKFKALLEMPLPVKKTSKDAVELLRSFPAECKGKVIKTLLERRFFFDWTRRSFNVFLYSIADDENELEALYAAIRNA